MAEALFPSWDGPHCYPLAPPWTFIIKDKVGLIKFEDVKVSKIVTVHPNINETLIGSFTTDGTGKISIPSGSLNPGDSIKIEVLVHEKNSVKHTAELSKMYRLYLDNADVNVNSGAISFDKVTWTANQEIVLDHATIAWNFIVSVEWDAKAAYLDSLAASFRYLSNYAYDCFDGQLRFDTILIFDNRVNWNKADIWIKADNTQWPQALVAGVLRPQTAVSCVEMPRCFFGPGNSATNLSYTQVPLPVDNYMMFATYLHELGHYLIGYYDEYKNKCTALKGVASHGFMDVQYPAPPNWRKPYNTETSNDSSYTLAACRQNEQYKKRNGSCWQYLEQVYEKKYGDINVPIHRPSERGKTFIPGPNHRFDSLNYDVGALTNVIVANANTGTKTVIATTILRRQSVTLQRNPLPDIFQGKTSSIPKGKIKVLGAKAGDEIWTSGKKLQVVKSLGVTETWWYGTATVSSSDSVNIVSTQVQGYYPLLCNLTLGNPGATFSMKAGQAFNASPSVEWRYEGGSVTYPFTYSGDTYAADIPSPLIDGGALVVHAVDSFGIDYFFQTWYTIATVDPAAHGLEVKGESGRCLVGLDSVNTDIQTVSILSSSYPVLRNGLDSMAIQGSNTYSISIYPPSPSLLGDNSIRFIYDREELIPETRAECLAEFTLRVHRWDELSNQWSAIGGFVDTAHSEVYMDIYEPGMYALFTTDVTGMDIDGDGVPDACDNCIEDFNPDQIDSNGNGIGDACEGCCQLRGDINGDSNLDISDLTYLVAYLFGGGETPPCVDEADVNASGSIDISDLTFVVAYLFQGGSPPLECQL